MEPSSGAVIASKNEHQRRPMASLTKIMTALVTISEVRNLDTTVTATSNSVDAGESEIYLEAGEQVKLEDLLYALMLKSANDAALAIAESVSGRREIFVSLMNLKAKKIGAYNTNFKNPHGLDEKDHFSTAYDLALITRYALSHPIFRKVVSTKETTITWINEKKTFKAYNHNKLLFRYPFVKGVKTGYTRKAGHCLATYAEKDGKRLICIVLNAPSSKDCYDDTLKLLNYGFSVLEKRKIVQKGITVKKLKLKEGTFKVVPYADVQAVLPKTYPLDLLDFKFVPTFKSDNNRLFGFLKIYLNERLISVGTAEAVKID